MNVIAKRLLNKFYHTRPTFIVTRFTAKCLPCTRKRKVFGSILTRTRTTGFIVGIILHCYIFDHKRFEQNNIKWGYIDMI